MKTKVEEMTEKSNGNLRISREYCVGEQSTSMEAQADESFSRAVILLGLYSIDIVWQSSPKQSSPKDMSPRFCT